ncbi:MAG: Gfo/Idh/MocA family oxidoreductase, partial [Mariniphaga sp.]|nr:Gfo/Idh/MocA family oxidoreductase [Mariniphaga sp.]
MKKLKTNLSRRNFIGTTTIGLAGITVLPMLKSCKTVTEDVDVKLGFIGLGRQAMFLLNGFLQIPGVKVLAGCDVYGRKRERFSNAVNNFYKEAGKEVDVEIYEKYQDILKREDLNAVVIATPDHTHAMIAIAACKAGKDVYLEKPLSFTIKEGQILRQTVRDTGRILGIGSQQRSDPNFQHAVHLVRSGALGTIEKANAYIGAPPKPYDLPAEPVPEDLNWNLWLGPLSASIHYNNELNPPITLDPLEHEKFWGGWRWYKETGGGFTTDWGAHMFDIVQWGLGMDENGPVEISPIGDGTEFISYKYANGVVMTSEPFNEQKTKGVKFIGDKGWIEVSRGYFNASDEKFNPEITEEEDGPYETRIQHQLNFIEAVRD